MQGVLALDRVTVRDADFSRAAFERFAPNGCVFERCDFRGELFDERLQTLFASRRQSIFRECRFAVSLPPRGHPPQRLANPSGPTRTSAEPEKSLTNEGVTTSAYRPFCDDNVLVLVALTS